MKHLFVIHSNTVLLSALGAIEHDKILEKDILFFYGRSFSSLIPSPMIKVVDTSPTYAIGVSKGFYRSPRKQRRLCEESDSLVNNYVNDNYTLYIPHTGMPFFQSLATNPNCIEICLLQEGAFSFFEKTLFSPRKAWLLNFLFSNKRLWWQINWQIPSFMKDNIRIKRTYSIDPHLYDRMDGSQNIKIKWPSNSLGHGIINEGAYVFLFESAVELGCIEKEIYMEGCRKLVCENEVKENYVKFHPNQSTNNKKEILRMFTKTVKEIPDNIPFELIMSSTENLHLFGFSTSLLKFGKDLGHNVISYSDYLCSKSLRFKKFYNTFNEK